MIEGIVSGIGSLGGLIGGVMDRFWPAQMSEEDRAKAQLELQKQVEGFIVQRVAHQRDIMMAELNQGDRFTKRARPTIVYAGLGFVFLIHVVLPMANWIAVLVQGAPLPETPEMSLPTEFWWAWTSVCGVYAIGRTMEKRGAEGTVGKVAKMITG